MIRKAAKNWRQVLQDAVQELHQANIRELEDARDQYPDAPSEWMRCRIGRIERRLDIIDGLEALVECDKGEVPFNDVPFA